MLVGIDAAQLWLVQEQAQGLLQVSFVSLADLA